MEHLTETLEPPEVWVAKYSLCPAISQRDPMEMSVQEIKDEIVKILYDADYFKELGATDRELITIVILQDKAHFFDFLKEHALTKWSTVGIWEKQVESNLQIEVEFRDNEGECLGNRVMHLLYSYNKKVVKEQVLYARTTPLEEGTLFF